MKDDRGGCEGGGRVMYACVVSGKGTFPVAGQVPRYAAAACVGGCVRGVCAFVGVRVCVRGGISKGAPHAQCGRAGGVHVGHSLNIIGRGLLRDLRQSRRARKRHVRAAVLQHSPRARRARSRAGTTRRLPKNRPC
jgi:hypothetical protein